MNTHIARIKRASEVPTTWAPEQKRELNELGTLRTQFHWDTADLADCVTPNIETLRYLLHHCHSQETRP